MGSLHLNKENISDVTEAPASDSPDGTKVVDESISNVPKKYRGTAADRRDMTSDALLTFRNNGGWPTTGLSAMVGLLTPMAVLVGYDCSVHMCKSHSKKGHRPQTTFALNGPELSRNGS
jgi:hypothetical protein